MNRELSRSNHSSPSTSQRMEGSHSSPSRAPLPPSRPATSPGSPSVISTPKDPPTRDRSMNDQGSAEHLSSSLHRLQQDLEAARDEINALHQMLEDLPEIFERKFRQRQRAFLDHHEQLLADNKALRERLYLVQASPQELPSHTRPALPGTERPPKKRLRKWIGDLLGHK